jgi:sugar phosphate permease
VFVELDDGPFFYEAFCNISHRLGGITPFGVFSDAFPGLKMRDTFACASVIFLAHFIISITVLENVPPDAGLQKRATFPL